MTQNLDLMSNNTWKISIHYAGRPTTLMCRTQRIPARSLHMAALNLAHKKLGISEDFHSQFPFKLD